MDLFLGGRFVPLTFSIGFIEKPMENVLDTYLRWIQKNYGVVETYPVQGSLSSVLLRLEPLCTPSRRSLILATKSWTAYFDNGTRGPDPATPVAYLTQQLRCRGLVVTCVPHTLTAETGLAKGTYGTTQFELFASEPREFLNCERSLCAAYEDGKWQFDAAGSVQPFEEVSQYAARKVADRFTPQMLQRYCEALGVRIFDEHFYCGPGLLVVIRDPLPKGAEEVSLVEAQKRITPD